MPFKSHKLATLAAVVVAAAAGGSAIAGAATDTTGATGSSSSKAAEPRSAETALTGDTATKVEKAALARVPGTVVRVETDDDGVYEAHVRKADGSEVEVRVDKSFGVTEVVDRPMGGRDGPGGHGPAGRGAGENGPRRP